MPVLTNGAVVIDSPGNTHELKGTLTAFKDPQGWWAGLITSAASVPVKADLIGKRVQLKAEDVVVASAEVIDCIELLAPTPTVQLLLRGEGEGPLAAR